MPKTSWARLKAIVQYVYNFTDFLTRFVTTFVLLFGVAAIVVAVVVQEIWLLISVSFLTGMAVTLGLFSIVYYSAKTSDLSRNASARWLSRAYRIVRAEYVYQLHDDNPNHHTERRTIDIEALEYGVDVFAGKYRWTGSGRDQDLKVESARHTLVGCVVRGTWKHYYIDLGTELLQHQPATIKIRQELYDDDGKFQLFLAKTVLEPLDHLVLRVVLPKNREPTNILYIERESADSTSKIISEKEGKLDETTREIRWEPLALVLGHRYEISWAWE